MQSKPREKKIKRSTTLSKSGNVVYDRSMLDTLLN